MAGLQPGEDFNPTDRPVVGPERADKAWQSVSPNTAAVTAVFGGGAPKARHTAAGGPAPAPGQEYLEPEYREHYQAWKADGNPSTSGRLLDAIKPIIGTALRSYVGVKVSPTMRARARAMALDAMAGYDPARAKIRTHLLSQMQGLRRLTAQENQIIKIPERVGLELGYIRDGERVLADKLGRDPTTVELADHLHLPARRIAHVRQAKPGLAEGQARTTDEDGHEDMALPGVLRESRRDLDPWYRFVYDDLTPQDRLIMEHSLGLFGRPILPKQDIARKLRVTPGAVSQRAAKIQQKLDAREETGGLF